MRHLVAVVALFLVLSSATHTAVAAAPDTFKDCDACPEMVVIPAGSFTMGSPANEEGRYNKEGPQHRVSIPRSFALGKYEVTKAEFAAFVHETGRDAQGCLIRDDGKWKDDDSKSWRNPGYTQSDSHPVVCVNWDDAKAYARWLSRKTGKEYRLPSESEWEYAARASTTTARYWGDYPDSACGYANVHDRTSKSENNFHWANHECDDGYAQTAPVGRFQANRFGPHDMLGNVWEWTEDCLNDSYSGAPTNGRAWITGECHRRVVRGGSWGGQPRNLRSAIRIGDGTGDRYYNNGFRVARTL